MQYAPKPGSRSGTQSPPPEHAAAFDGAHERPVSPHVTGARVAICFDGAQLPDETEGASIATCMLVMLTPHAVATPVALVHVPSSTVRLALPQALLQVSSL